MMRHLAATVLAGLSYHIGGYEHRFIFVDGFTYEVVGRYYWERTRIAHQCRSVEIKRYEHERVVVHLCTLA